MAGIEARCTHCEAANSVSRDLAGERVVCSECGWKFLIPLTAGRGGGSAPARCRNVSSRESPPSTPIVVGAGIAVALLLLIIIASAWRGDGSQLSGGHNVGNEPDKSRTGFMGQTPDQAAKEVLDKITSTPEGRAAADRLGNKDDQLTAFQRAHGISDRIAEAAIKEWVITHAGNFDWDLEDVKAICLRNLRSGIPHEYLPEAKKRR